MASVLRRRSSDVVPAYNALVYLLENPPYLASTMLVLYLQDNGAITNDEAQAMYGIVGGKYVHVFNLVRLISTYRSVPGIFVTCSR